MIDLRSDTVTKPTSAMLAAMFAAEVGDDVFGEDPSINQLEVETAKFLGKEAALYVPSGTMANQIAVRLHCRPGEEILCEQNSHVILWEGGGPAALSGVTCRGLPGEFGVLTLNDLKDQPRPSDIHNVQTKLIWIENTHNRGGGTITSIDTLRAIREWSLSHGLKLHIDGARLWNAAVATGVPMKEWCREADTVSVCFSKGLGAPVGSAIVGDKETITQARRIRKLFGGAMRQAGFIAEACRYALHHHVERLADDHRNAQIIADAVRSTPGLTLVPDRVETNLIWMEVDPSVGTPAEVAARWHEQGVAVAPLGGRTIRAVTHLDVSTKDCERAAEVIRSM